MLPILKPSDGGIMKGYILFLIFVLGSFALAAENNVGTVRIKNTSSARLDSSGKIIPNSMNTLLKITHVFVSAKYPGFVVLVPEKQSGYDAFVISFNRFQDKAVVSQRFGSVLKKGFVIDVSPKDVRFDSTHYLSILEADVNNLKAQSSSGEAVALTKCSKEDTNMFGVWASDVLVAKNCL
jgi:hypothetical protein